MNYNEYDKIILFFSGGKDSVYCYLQLLEAGVKPNQIELHHHLIDGNEGSTLMDWPITESYCRAFGKAFGSEVFMSWKIGGFEQEMLRDNSPTAAIMFEDENHNLVLAEGNTKNPSLNTRRKFPQISADLSVRYCSAYLKIDVSDRLIRRQFRFSGDKKYLVITGERAEESAARAKYKDFETHRSFIDGKRAKRLIYHARIAKNATEKQVWDLLKQYGVNPHPAYQAGWGRTSCLTCIFGSANQWATVAKYMPDHLSKVIGYEKEFGVTIHRALSIEEQVDLGTPYNVEPEVYKLAMSKDYTDNIILSGSWDLPKGAFGDSSGPT